MAHILVSILHRSFLFLILLLILVSGCAKTTVAVKPAATAEERERERVRVQNVFSKIDEQNRTRKRSPEYLKEAYQGIGIRKLNDIPRDRFTAYAGYLHKDQLLVVVHPGYYAFFQHTGQAPAGETRDGYPVQNVVERLTADLRPDQKNFLIMREQERVLRDFLEFAAQEKKLVVVIVPGGYKDHMTVKPGSDRDEYARFLNDLTNRGESIVYLESATWSDGFLSPQELELFSSFVTAVGARRVVIGGGYIGMCLDNFYSSIANTSVPRKNAAFAIDLTTASPLLDPPLGVELLDKDGRLDVNGLKQYFRAKGDALLKGDVKRLRRNPLYEVYVDR